MRRLALQGNPNPRFAKNLITLSKCLRPLDEDGQPSPTINDPDRYMLFGTMCGWKHVWKHSNTYAYNGESAGLFLWKALLGIAERAYGRGPEDNVAGYHGEEWVSRYARGETALATKSLWQGTFPQLWFGNLPGQDNVEMFWRLYPELKIAMACPNMKVRKLLRHEEPAYQLQGIYLSQIIMEEYYEE